MTIFSKIIETAKTATLNIIAKTAGWERAWLRTIESALQGNKLNQPYSQYEWCYVAVREIAGAIAQIPFRYMNGKQELESSPIKDLFQNPNPLMNKYQFKEAIMTLLLLEGDAIVVPYSSTGGTFPDQLWVFQKKDFRIITDKSTGQLAYYQMQDSSRTLFRPYELCHIKLYNPYDRFWGLSPLSAARLSMDADYNAQSYNKAVIDNFAEPAGIITVDAPVTNDQIKVIREQWEDRHKGAHRAGRLAVLQKGMDYKTIAIPQKDMEFLSQRKYNREAILAIYQIPKGVVGITDDLNYATLFGQKRIFWQDTITPYIQSLQLYFNTLIQPFAKGTVIEFDTSNVPELQEDFTEKVDNAVKLAKMGWPINMINERLNLGMDDVPWGDTHFIPQGMIPVEMAGTIQLQANQKPPEEPKSLPAIRISPTDANVKFAHWAKFVSTQDVMERKYLSKIKRYLWEQRGKVLSIILNRKKDIDDYQAFVWDEENDKLVEITKPLYTEATVRGSQLMATILATESFDLVNPLVDMKAEFRCNKITRINDTLQGLIRDELNEGLKQGESLFVLSDRVKNIYNMARHRANTIARTETAGAMNDGEFLMFEKEGVKEKEWLSARDGKERESHRNEDGNIAKLYDPFPVTGLQYPHDPNGGAREVINCRCSMLPVID